MSIEFIVFLVALIVITFIYRSFYSFVYFTVIIDIFLRIVSYLKENILRTDALNFLDYVPDSVSTIIKSWDFGLLTEVLLFLLVIIYIIFLALTIKHFIKKKF